MSIFWLFQFLIGRLKTYGFNSSYKGADEFQFLIGRLKTKIALCAP